MEDDLSWLLEPDSIFQLLAIKFLHTTAFIGRLYRSCVQILISQNLLDNSLT